ncbi:unnamed protein product [Vicia faba]|uniref:Uncharacterized protein n=1 Tax=Vicia faba TaxID=3906 RepID=A0AAV1AKX8_VICFA|nr:unnamed protein product [Vicia faba]
MSLFLKGLRFITPKAFSKLLKLSREYQMLTKSVREGRTCCLLAISPRSCTARSSSPASPFPLSPFVLPSKSRMEYSQVVRHRFLVPACKGSNPFNPDYEHPIGSVKNKLTTTREAADCSP